MTTTDKFMKLWIWEDAPEEYKQLYSQGGDEDWLLFIPKEISWNFKGGLADYPWWIDNMDVTKEPIRYDAEDGIFLVGTHA